MEREREREREKNGERERERGAVLVEIADLKGRKKIP